MIPPQCILAYGSSPVRISHNAIPNEKTSTWEKETDSFVVNVLMVMSFWSSRNIRLKFYSDSGPFQRPCCYFRSVILVPSREGFRGHHLIQVYFVWFLTTQNHQPAKQQKFQHKFQNSWSYTQKKTNEFQKLRWLNKWENLYFVSSTLQTGRWLSLKLTSKLSHFKSKWTMFFKCKYSMPKAASIAIISFLRRSSDLQKQFKTFD